MRPALADVPFAVIIVPFRRGFGAVSAGTVAVFFLQSRNVPGSSFKWPP
jgi:hypothetical protein